MTSTFSPDDIITNHRHIDHDNSSFFPGTDNSSLHNGTDVAIRVLSRFHLIALPTIAVLGILGNILSFCIFISKTFRRTSCSLYLAARCLSDTGFLLSVFITWLGDAMGVPVIHTVVVCQVVVFASYVFGFLSVWLVVCITLENYIRICHPFSVCRYCTVQRARVVLVALLLLSVAIYQFPLWTTHVFTVGNQQFCGNKVQFIHIFEVLVYVDMVITLALPSVVIIFFMVAIVVSLVRSFKRQSRLKGSTRQPPPNNPPQHSTTTFTTTPANGVPAEDPDPTQDQDHAPDQGHDLDPDPGQDKTNGKLRNTAPSNSTAKKKRPPRPLPSRPSAAKLSANAASRRSMRGRAQAKVTRLLFAVSFTFLVLSLPSHIVRLRFAMLRMMAQASQLSPTLEEMLQVVFQILYYLSFAVNLLVYLTCGESFRNVFFQTYVTCFLDRSFKRRRSEMSRTSYTMVKQESPPDNATPGGEEETALAS